MFKIVQETKFENQFNYKKLTLTAVALLGVGRKPYVYTHRRTRFLDEFGKKYVLDGWFGQSISARF
jgi:hypothetical protein